MTRTAPTPATGLPGWLAGRRPLPRCLLSALAGMLAALAMPPIGLVPVYLISLPALVWLAEGVATRRGAFLLGWAHAFGFHLIGLYWVAVSMTVDPAFYWMVPFGVVGLPALLALLAGLAVALWWSLPGRGPGKVLLLAVLLLAGEYVRGFLFTGFPWNLPGYAWVPWLPVLQTAALVGIYGLSLVTLALGLVPAMLAGPHRGRAGWGIAVLLVALTGAGAAWGWARLPDGAAATVPEVRLRLVQPNIPQELKWVRELWDEHFETLSDLTRQAPEGAPPTVVIWPETAIPYMVTTSPATRQALARLAPDGGLLITGAPRTEETTAGERRYYNSLVAIDGAGAVQGVYDKHHLVPFGEYMPLGRWLPLQSIAGRSDDYSFGPGPATLALPGLPPVAPFICYEAIFPGAVTGSERPGWLLNITNDGWFGRSWGPHQHFATAVARAVEEGLPLVRVAGTGISGVVDPYGRTLSRLDLGVRGIIDADLPAALEATPYARWHDLPLAVMALLFAAISAALLYRRG
ncbi:MAG: apolipoprotein N-acyltransferase [Azospirillaceae bacterium]